MSNKVAIGILMNEYLKEKELLDKEIYKRKEILNKDLMKIQDLCSHESFRSDYFRDYHKGEDNYHNKCDLCGKLSYSEDKGVF